MDIVGKQLLKIELMVQVVHNVLKLQEKSSSKEESKEVGLTDRSYVYIKLEGYSFHVSTSVNFDYIPKHSKNLYMIRI